MAITWGQPPGPLISYHNHPQPNQKISLRRVKSNSFKLFNNSSPTRQTIFKLDYTIYFILKFHNLIGGKGGFYKYLIAPISYEIMRSRLKKGNRNARFIQRSLLQCDFDRHQDQIWNDTTSFHFPRLITTQNFYQRFPTE